VASRDNSLSGTVSTEKKVPGRGGNHFESQERGVVLPQHLPAPSSNGPLASDHQRSSPAKTWVLALRLWLCNYTLTERTRKQGQFPGHWQ